MKPIKPLILLMIASIFLLSFTYTFDNPKAKNDLEGLGLKGKVKSIVTSEFMDNKIFAKQGYIYNENGNIIEERNYFGLNWDSYQKNIYLYNEKGELIEKDFYNTGIISSKMKYKYGKNLLEEIIYYTGTTPSDKYLFQYDKKGNLIERVFFTENYIAEKYVYEYDKKGNLSKHTYYVPNDSNGLVLRFLVLYDLKGNIIEESTHHNDGVWSTKYIYKYDKKGYKTEWINYSLLKNDTLEKTVYQNDIYGNVLTQNKTRKDSGKLITSSISYIYEYDKIGNWTKQTASMNDYPYKITTREIKYY